MLNDPPVPEVPPTPSAQSRAPLSKNARRVAIAGVLAGALLAVTGLCAVAYCAYVSWHRIDVVPAGEAGDPSDMTSWFEALHSVAMGAVAVTLAGAAVMGVALWVLPRKTEKN